MEDYEKLLENIKKKKTLYCEAFGYPIPSFDKEEDFYITSEMLYFVYGEKYILSRIQCLEKEADTYRLKYVEILNQLEALDVVLDKLKQVKKDE